MVRRLLALALLACGCTASIPVHLGTSAGAFDDVDLVLEDAGAAIGIPIETVDSPYGAITVGLVEHGGLHAGEQLVDDGCLRALWVEPDGVLLAHELAHTLGFEGHVDCEPGDPDLMCERLDRGLAPEDVEFGGDDEIDASLSNLNSCTGRGAR